MKYRIVTEIEVPGSHLNDSEERVRMLAEHVLESYPYRGMNADGVKVLDMRVTRTSGPVKHERKRA